MPGSEPPRPPPSDQESDLVFVDNADEARVPKKKRPKKKPRPPSADSQRAAPPSSGTHRAHGASSQRSRPRKGSGAHPKPPSGTHQARRRPSGANKQPHTRRVKRKPQTERLNKERSEGARSASVRMPPPALDKLGPDPHLRIDGDTTGRPYCLVSAVLKEPHLLSRERKTVIGRGETADVRVRSHLVSREHAEIRWEGRTFALVDLGSTNGSFVNGYPLRDLVPLRDKDMIVVGNFEILVKVLEPGVDPEGYLEDGLTRKFNVRDR